VVFDDPEPDEFIRVMPRNTWQFFKEQQRRHKNWRNKSRRERLDIFRQMKNRGGLEKACDGFDNYDSLMRSDLNALKRVQVDYAQIPFGHDSEQRGIYGGRHGDEYYIGPRQWVLNTTARNTFLTTESVTADIIKQGFTRSYRLNLTSVPGIYPLKIPTFLDKRAGADRKDQQKVSALAQEIRTADPNAVIISDGVHGVEDVKTFQSMKGLNGLEDRDVYIYSDLYRAREIR